MGGGGGGYLPGAQLNVLQNDLQVCLFSVSGQRCLDLQEYQSKELMKNHGINVQRFRVADGDNDVSELVKQLGIQHS